MRKRTGAESIRRAAATVSYSSLVCSHPRARPLQRLGQTSIAIGYFPAQCASRTPVQRLIRANCKWVHQKLDSRFRGNDIALRLFSVMPALRLHSGQAPAGIQCSLSLRNPLRILFRQSKRIRRRRSASQLGPCHASRGGRGFELRLVLCRGGLDSVELLPVGPQDLAPHRLFTVCQTTLNSFVYLLPE